MQILCMIIILLSRFIFFFPVHLLWMRGGYSLSKLHLISGSFVFLWIWIQLVFLVINISRCPFILCHSIIGNQTILSYDALLLLLILLLLLTDLNHKIIHHKLNVSFIIFSRLIKLFFNIRIINTSHLITTSLYQAHRFLLIRAIERRPL